MAKVLLVDNDPTTVSLLKILLELDGHSVVTCTVAGRVLDAVSKEKPDLVLMDVYLTGGDGLEILRGIRSHPVFGRLPVIMTSGMELSEECARDGADSFLLKPYTPEHLAATMKQALDHAPDPDAAAESL
jgi:CheY-like chemotaxis protein